MARRRRFNSFFYFWAVVIIGLIIAWDVINMNKDKIHINDLANLTPSTEYQIKRVDFSLQSVVPSVGTLGSFYHCLKSYKPSQGWLSPKEGKEGSKVLQIVLDEEYLMYMSVSENQAYEVFFYKYDKEGNWLWETNFAVNCDLNLLNKSDKSYGVRLLGKLNSEKPYKELYTSNPELPLPKNRGRLGAFYSCLTNHKPWREKASVVEKGMIKLDLFGYILHLGVVDNKAVNFSVERYGLKRETLELSETYQVDCNLNLLDT
ncbi:hypothetical protein [Pseudoalteromonas rubra]|uniref:hypothetical protein n=1 Tax=Pseudoalteromonas rubra TaxID=43658 RepID=UPI000F7A76AB|nr:hypothetical protein [Pseudoalteromonas rubra]